MLQSIIMEIYIVIATAFVLGAAIALFWSKSFYEKQLQKVNSASRKQIEELWVEKTIAEQSVYLNIQQKTAQLHR